eukprot:1137503-Pelagomonas_calceolata.AAC.1
MRNLISLLLQDMKGILRIGSIIRVTRGWSTADLKLQPKDDKCWTAQLIQAFKGLHRSEIFEQAVRTGGAISMNDFSADL